MGILVAKQTGRTMARWLWAASLFLAPAACSRIEAGDPAAPTPNHAATAQRLAATPPSLTTAAPERLAAFQQALAHRLDRSRMTTRPASAQGGVINIPNGYAAHASVLVRQPDGTLRSACVSSPAEVAALVKQVRNGAEP